MGWDFCPQDHSHLPIVVPSGILSSLPGRESSSMLLAAELRQQLPLGECCCMGFSEG